MEIKIIIAFAMLTTSLSCNTKTEKNYSIRTNDSIQTVTNKPTYDRTENLTLSIRDTLKKSASYFFSNSQTKDLFLLTIEPGIVKNSKSSFQIITTDNKVIYSQSFNTYYFMRLIYEPDSIPTTNGQDTYDKYMENYWKSITTKQYEIHFQKSVDSFFDAISAIDKSEYAGLKNWDGNITDEDFYKEITTDTNIRLFDITCFDCDEGGAIIGYSKKQNKIVTLMEHD